VHDTIPMDYPEYARPGQAERHRERIETIAALADGVVVNSEATAGSLAPYLERSGRRVPAVVAHPGAEFVAPCKPPEAVGKPPYFVCIGTIEPRKNHLLLLHLWRALAARRDAGTPRLVLIGQRGWEIENIVDIIDRCRALDGLLEEHNTLPDRELRPLLAGARALLCPAFVEGYGLPIAEALALGVPVICSDIPVFREVGLDVPEFLDPLDGLGWLQAIRNYSETGSPRRAAQMARLPGWQAPRWEPHIDAVIDLIEQVSATGTAMEDGVAKKKRFVLLKRLVASPARQKQESQPEDKADELIRAANAAQNRREWETAEGLWKQASEKRPDNVNCWLQLGNMRNELSRYQAAIAAFETAARLDPQASEALVGIAGVHERAGDWDAALGRWTGLVRLLEDPARLPRPSDKERREHAFLHAALSASMADQRELALDIIVDATGRVPGFAELPGQLLMRARAVRQADPLRALALLRQCLERAPDDDPARFEFGSIALEHGKAAEWAEAAGVVEAALARRPDDLSYLWLTADLRERLREWWAVQVLSERMAGLAPGEPRYLRRALDGALARKDLLAGRRMARAFLRIFPGEFIALHLLARGYEDAEELNRARLLFRFLRAKWPHSVWHDARVVVLTAARRSLPEADRLLRAAVAARGRDIELDRAYCDAAFRSGNFAETRRRLDWFLSEHPQDEEAELFIGYVIANTTGIEDAERHYQAMATRSFQAKGALIGLAHMAMRRREPQIVHERWAALVELYPEDTIGRVEYARSAYEIRDFELALQICEAQLRLLPSDVTMGEFYAWLLAAIGRYEAAWTYLQSLRKHTGRSWAVLELSLLSSAQTGRLDVAFEGILESVPLSGTRRDGGRFYHAIRQLWSARRPDLLPALINRARVEPRHLAWLSPYLRGQEGEPSFRTRVDVAWSQARGMVRGDTAARVREASDAEIVRLLDRPRHAFPTVHIVNKFEQMRGGSELHALDVGERLSQYANVEFWAPEMPHPHFSGTLGVKAIEPGQGRVPRGGVLVIVGVYFNIVTWIRRARPKRVIFLYNTFEAPLLYERLHEVFEQTGVRSELLYCSDMMAREVDLPGFFEPSPVDIELFRPRKAPVPAEHRFTVGRHSRDVIEKHHAQDWKVYEVVAQAGGMSRLLGGTCMELVFRKTDSIEFLPARNDGIVEFLQGLDCYYYNTSTWIEPWGRVVIEAMACGLPVLVSDTGGYAQAVEHGRTGLVFRTVDEGVELMRHLVADVGLRERLGREARRSVETLLGAPALARLVSFYLAQSS
jgi:glycosyltransferase involved in cell wall biosynthesis/tetratricopeptide (TPR) repeat protein